MKALLLSKYNGTNITADSTPKTIKRRNPLYIRNTARRIE